MQYPVSSGFQPNISMIASSFGGDFFGLPIIQMEMKKKCCKKFKKGKRCKKCPNR